MPELDTSVFIIPRDFVKNGLDRYAVLNRIAKSVIESCRGEHPEFVFTRDGKPVAGINNSGWKAARRRAAKQYAEQFRKPCPAGFRSIRVHDLKHTYGHRLRAAGVGFEDRKLLLGHKSNHVTTHYSARAGCPDQGIRDGLRPRVPQKSRNPDRQSDRRQCQVI